MQLLNQVPSYSIIPFVNRAISLINSTKKASGQIVFFISRSEQLRCPDGVFSFWFSLAGSCPVKTTVDFGRIVGSSRRSIMPSRALPFRSRRTVGVDQTPVPFAALDGQVGFRFLNRRATQFAVPRSLRLSEVPVIVLRLDDRPITESRDSADVFRVTVHERSGNADQVLCGSGL